MNEGIVVRKNQIEHVWRIEYPPSSANHFFQNVLFIQGTETEMRDYLESEVGKLGHYCACGAEEVSAIRRLRLKIYMAPREE